MKAFDARDCVRGCDEPLTQLSQQWLTRHEGLRKPAPTKTKGLVETPCLRENCCHCRSNNVNRTLAAAVSCARHVLQTMFPPKSVKLEELMAGNVVLRWRTLGQNEVVEHFVHVSLQYLRPWRPTCLHLALKKESEQGILPRFCDFVVRLEDNQPVFHTFPQFVASLDHTRNWSVEMWLLSDKLVGYPGANSQVRAYGVGSSDAQLNVLEFTALRVQPPQGWGARLQPGADHSEVELSEGEEDDNDEETNASGSRASLGEHVDDMCLSAELLQVWDSMVTRGDTQDRDAGGDDQSSSSSSSSSTSSSSTGSKAKVTQPHTGSDEVEKVDSGPVAASVGATEVRRDPENHFRFGSGHFVQRRKDQKLVGYHMHCPFHTKCTKEIACSVAGGEAEARRFIKAWMLLGPGCGSKADHMDGRHKSVLLQALKEGTLCTEGALDEMANVFENGLEMPAPFTQPGEVGGQASSAGTSLLGNVNAGVSEALHAEMEGLAAQRSIPITTSAQRRRNTISSNSQYDVPQPLAAAFRAGYIHPNLPPLQACSGCRDAEAFGSSQHEADD